MEKLVIETHALIDKYMKPVFVEWEPSEFDMKYRFKPTAKGQLKLQRERDKQNAKRKAVFDDESAQKKSAHDTVDSVAAWPEPVARMFMTVYSRVVDSIEFRHAEYLNALEEFRKKYGDGVANYWMSVAEVGRHYSGIARRGYVYDEPTQDEWNYAIRMCGGAPGEYPLKRVENFVECVAFARRIKNLAESDPVRTEGFAAYANAISRITAKLIAACSAVRECFDGAVPDGCENAHWGAKGEFAGILTGNGRRISFCSFSAGGHAIQRFHWRYKITPLKG